MFFSAAVSLIRYATACECATTTARTISPPQSTNMSKESPRQGATFISTTLRFCTPATLKSLSTHVSLIAYLSHLYRAADATCSLRLCWRRPEQPIISRNLSSLLSIHSRNSCAVSSTHHNLFIPTVLRSSRQAYRVLRHKRLIREFQGFAGRLHG